MKKKIKSSTILLLIFISLTAFKNEKNHFDPGSTKMNLIGTQNTLWEVDWEHSSVCFTIVHLGIADVMGMFKKFNGKMESTGEDFTNAKINISVDVNSIDSNNEIRDKHLKSNDFFNAVKFPEMKFESNSFKKQKGNNYKLSGELTIRDITKNASFNVEHLGTVMVTGIQKVAFRATTTINRSDFNLNWNTTTPDGILIVGDKVTIALNLEMTKGI